MRGQVSVEYLIIVGIALGVLVPAVYFFYSYSQSSQASNAGAQINDIGLQTIAAIKSVHALGRNARDTVSFVLPAGVDSITVNGNELVFSYETNAGISEAVFFSPVLLKTESPDGVVSSVPGGLRALRVESMGSAGVNITEATT